MSLPVLILVCKKNQKGYSYAPISEKTRIFKFNPFWLFHSKYVFITINESGTFL